MSFSFSKYSGVGNDFIFVDNREVFFPMDKGLIQSLCNRYEGIGADGLVLLEKSARADYKMRIFNPDGGEAEMCGNALRCLYLFLEEKGGIQPTYFIETLAGLHKISRKGEEICCEMGEVSSIEWDIELSFNQTVLRGHFLNTGVPHFVIPTTHLHQIPILPLGRFIREHKRFQPRGTNVNFMSLNQDRVLEVRTYERGVELETQACGTGCAAAAVLGHKLYALSFPIQVKTLQGKILKFNFDYSDGKVTHLEMTGPAKFSFDGKCPLPASLLCRFN